MRIQFVQNLHKLRMMEKLININFILYQPLLPLVIVSRADHKKEHMGLTTWLYKSDFDKLMEESDIK
ncbi:hypothetical protein [Clostridium sp. JN-9]|uniref:hypothetical protein n=1 Tax=Clostridium sp. JN-9 TaxID=2507159 RepID=UPI0026D12313